MSQKENVIRYFNVLNLLTDPEWSWEFHYKLLKKYIIERNKIPTYDEKYYGCLIRLWFEQQMNNLMSLSDKQRTLLSELSPTLSQTESTNYRSTKVHKFYNHLELLAQFISQNKRLPLYKETYMSFGLCNWVKRVPTQFKNGKITEQMYNDFLAVLQGV